MHYRKWLNYNGRLLPISHALYSFPGFPPIIPDDTSGDENLSIMNDILPGGTLSEFYWGYVKKWWSHRNDPNVLLLHYTNVRHDLKGHVAKIASFLEVELSEEELDTVTERCGIEHMKKVNRFDYKVPLNSDEGLWDLDKDTIIYEGKIFRKGEVGTGKAGLPPFIFTTYIWLVFYHAFYNLPDQADPCSVTSTLHNGIRPRRMNSDTTPHCSGGRERVVNSQLLSRKMLARCFCFYAPQSCFIHHNM